MRPLMERTINTSWKGSKEDLINSDKNPNGLFHMFVFMEYDKLICKLYKAKQRVRGAETLLRAAIWEDLLYQTSDLIIKL